jgi:PAS domain S-box-containing protein
MTFAPGTERLRLYKTVRAACDHHDVDRALATVLRLFAEAHGWAVAEAWVPRPDGNALEMAPVCYCREDRFRPFVDMALGFVVDRSVGLPGSAWQSRQPLVTPDVREEPRFARASWGRDVDLRGALTVPVPAGEPVVILCFFDTVTRALDAELVESLDVLGADIASLVRRRRRGPDLERQLRVTEERYRALFERSPAGIFVAGVDGAIVERNAAFTRIVGDGRRFPDLLADPGDWARLLTRLDAESSISDVDLRLRSRDGEARWGLATMLKVDDAAGSARVEGQVVDVTGRNRREQAQRDALRNVAALARGLASDLDDPVAVARIVRRMLDVTG